ncbi:MAG: OsmC family protein [Candidatus Omnitrophota bacterium]
MKQYIYKTAIQWSAEKKGIASVPGKPDLEIAAPPEFKGHPGIWSPEDLLVAAVNSCFMLTFLHFAPREGFKITSYEAQAEGVLEIKDGIMMVSSVKIMPKISLQPAASSEQIHKLCALSKENCFISNSVRSKIEVIL